MSTTSRPDRIVTARLSQLALISLASFASTPVAHAHISVEMGGTHKSRAGEGELKEAPCGVANSPRSANVYKYKPGATITLSVAETIPHPGYFRVAFDTDGTDGFVEPSGTSGEGGNCAGDAKCGEGKEDYCNNDTVLLDNLDQHDGGATKTYTWSVKLPNVECANCTLQVIQVMNDLNVHFAPYPEDDIYHACIDIELSNSAPDVTDAPVTNNGMTCAPSTNPGAAGSGAAGSAAAGSGAAGSGTAGAAAAGSGAAGSSAGAAGASGSAGMASTAGSAASPSAGSAGSRPSSPTSAAAGASGRPATGAAGSTPTMSGMNAQTAAGSAAPAAPAASGSSGGCQTAPASSFGLVGPLALALLALTWRRRTLLQAASRRAERRS